MAQTAYPHANLASRPIGAEIHSVQRDSTGTVRFSLRLRIDDSEINITGFRYYPETDELKPPCYRVGKGWQPTVQLSGPILDELREVVRRLAVQAAQ